MKISRILFIAPLFFFFSAGEHRYVYKTASIEFHGDGTNLEPGVIDQMDALFDDLDVGWRVELNVVGEREIVNDYARACEVSQQRCNALLQYLASRGVDEFDITVHQYRKQLLVKSVPLISTDAFSRRYVTGISFTKEEQPPLMFTNSKLPQAEELCITHGLNNSKHQVIYHPLGMEVHIPSYAFENYSGWDPDCGSINLQVCYYANPKDFVRGGVTSNSGRHMLESGGMVYVGATCLGAELKLIDGKEIQVVMPKNFEADGNMTFFSGRERFGLINWSQTNQGHIIESAEEGGGWGEDAFDLIDGEGLSSLDNYFITSSKLGWINADYFVEVRQPQRMAVELNEQKKDIAVRMVFKDMNSVMPGFYYNSDSLIMFEGIPTGERVTVVAYGTVDDEFYWASREVTVGETRLIRLDPQPVSSGQSLDDLVSSL